MLTRTQCLWTAAAIGLTATAQGALVARYTFDEASSGTTAALDTGAVTPAANGDFNLNGSATRTGNTPGGFSLGAMSTPGGTNDYVNIADPGTGDKFANLSAMTITLWVNFQAAPVAGDRLVSKAALGKGFDLRIATVGSGTATLAFSMLQSDINYSALVSNSFSTAPGWKFIAASMQTDVSGTTDNAWFFIGEESTSASSLGSPTGTLAMAAVDTTADLRIGGTAATTSDRTPPAWFDDVRIYNTAITSAGEMDAIRLANVPEPHALLGLGLAASTVILRRRRAC